MQNFKHLWGGMSKAQKSHCRWGVHDEKFCGLVKALKSVWMPHIIEVFDSHSLKKSGASTSISVYRGLFQLDSHSFISLKHICFLWLSTDSCDAKSLWKAHLAPWLVLNFKSLVTLFKRTKWGVKFMSILTSACAFFKVQWVLKLHRLDTASNSFSKATSTLHLDPPMAGIYWIYGF